VPAHRRQEVAVLPRRGAGPQVLRAARPPRPWPFKKACGSRRPGAQRGGRHQPRRRPRPPHGRRAPASRARPLPHQRPPRPQRRACDMSRALRADILGWASESRGETESAGITMSCACCDFFSHSQKSQLLKKPVWDVRWHVSLAAGSLRLLLCYVCIVLFCLPPCCRGACLWLCLACHCDTGTRADKFYFAVLREECLGGVGWGGGGPPGLCFGTRGRGGVRSVQHGALTFSEARAER
jgi:hypothetical protein